MATSCLALDLVYSCTSAEQQLRAADVPGSSSRADPQIKIPNLHLHHVFMFYFHHNRFVVRLVLHWDTRPNCPPVLHTWTVVSGVPVGTDTAACGRGTGPVYHGEPSVCRGGPWTPCPAAAAAGSTSSSPPGPWSCSGGVPSPAEVDLCGPCWSNT